MREEKNLKNKGWKKNNNEEKTNLLARNCKFMRKTYEKYSKLIRKEIFLIDQEQYYFTFLVLVKKKLIHCNSYEIT